MYKLKFKLLDNVKIKPLENIKGIIMSIWICEEATKYEVRYFNNGKPELVYFYEWELKNE